MGYYGENGLEIYCDSGDLAETDDCPCGCPSFEGRSIIYVDKKATGTGDGSSWANAYTNIQTAINAHPKKEIQIQGYGESDCYPAGITLIECTYLKGIDDVWLDGSGNSTGIDGNNIESTKIENINIINAITAFYRCFNLIDCFTKNHSGDAYNFCQIINNCGGVGIIGFVSCSFITNCSGIDFFFISCNDISSCSASFSSPWSAVFIRSNNIISCSVTSSRHSGFFLCDNVISSDAQNCQDCGFTQCTNLTGNTESNNCLSGSASCTPNSPTYNCDTV